MGLSNSFTEDMDTVDAPLDEHESENANEVYIFLFSIRKREIFEWKMHHFLLDNVSFSSRKICLF